MSKVLVPQRALGLEQIDCQESGASFALKVLDNDELLRNHPFAFGQLPFDIS